MAKPHLLNEKQFFCISVIVTFEFSLCILNTCIFVVVVSFYKLLTGAVFGPSKLLGDTSKWKIASLRVGKTGRKGSGRSYPRERYCVQLLFPRGDVYVKIFVEDIYFVNTVEHQFP